jgi:hypothetical protein
MVKRCQAAFEYLIILGFMIAIIVPVSYFYLYSVESTTKDVVQSAVDNLGKTFADTSHDVYYSSGYAKRSMHMVVPEQVLSISGQRTREIIIELETPSGPMFKSYHVDVPIGVQMDSAELSGGAFVIEKRSSVVMLCTGQCTCAAGEICNDGVDNDCDGQADLCDNSCAGTTDADNDGWTVECDIDDCDDGSKRVNPVGTEICGNGIDEDCDGGDLPC